MVDMWMLSVAAALIGTRPEWDCVALTKLEEAVRAVPGLGDALDAARAATAADRIRLADVLAEGIKAAYDAGGKFANRLDTLWPEVLFGPTVRRSVNINTGDVHGSLIQAGSVVGPIDLRESDPPSPTWSRFAFFGADRRGNKRRS